MQRPTIPDKDIPNADQEQLVYCFMPWVKKIAFRYRELLDQISRVDEEDLFQVGSLALLKAQKNYDPEGGASFLGFSKFYIRSAMRRELGYSSDGQLPPSPVSLDKTLDDEADDSILDIIEDPNIQPFDEAMIEAETREKTVAEVHAAVDRLKSQKQHDIIKRIWFDGEARNGIAADMGLSHQRISAIEKNGFRKLSQDEQLKKLAYDVVPFIHVGSSRFNTTWTSATEWAVLWREEHLAKLTSKNDAAAEA